MPTIKKSDEDIAKKMQDQIRVSVMQAIMQVLGPGYSAKVISANLDVGNLMPVGQNVAIKMSIDIYPKDSP